MSYEVTLRDLVSDCGYTMRDRDECGLRDMPRDWVEIYEGPVLIFCGRAGDARAFLVAESKG